MLPCPSEAAGTAAAAYASGGAAATASSGAGGSGQPWDCDHIRSASRAHSWRQLSTASGRGIWGGGAQEREAVSEGPLECELRL